MKLGVVLFLLGYFGMALHAVPAAGLITLSLRVFPPEATLSVDGVISAPIENGGITRAHAVAMGRHSFVLAADGYTAKEVVLHITHDTEIEEKLERQNSGLRKLGEVGTGRGPKSVMFTTDGNSLVVALLFGNGIEIFSREPLLHAQSITLDEHMAGFVELAYNGSAGEIWVSQMLTNSIHVVDADTFEPLRVFDSGGVWPKVITFSPDEKTAYASHWKTLDVSVIDAHTGKVRGAVPVVGIPRGLAASPDGEFLLVTNFSDGGIEIVNAETRRITGRIDGMQGAMRHVVLDAAGDTAYGSDMYRGRVAKIDLSSRAVNWSPRLASNPNTIALSPNGKYLYVSCRGKNNEANWHERGEEYGKIFVLDAITLEIVEWLWGRNQPTGLAVSPDGTLIAFTNFYDDTIELYQINP
jgi:DNA-binding beta-propeller fold protein YncE